MPGLHLVLFLAYWCVLCKSVLFDEFTFRGCGELHECLLSYHRNRVAFLQVSLVVVALRICELLDGARRFRPHFKRAKRLALSLALTSAAAAAA